MLNFHLLELILIKSIFVGNQVCEDYSHRLVIKEDGVRSLIISPAKPDDSGKYTIIAKNQAGKAFTSLSLTVIREYSVS